MTQYTRRQARGKSDHSRIDDVTDAELAIVVIAARFHLPVSIARVICEQAHIGRNDDRASSTGGRAK